MGNCLLEQVSPDGSSLSFMGGVKSIFLAFIFSTKYSDHEDLILDSLYTSMKSSINLQGQAPFSHSKYVCEDSDQRPLGFPDKTVKLFKKLNYTS